MKKQIVAAATAVALSGIATPATSQSTTNEGYDATVPVNDHDDGGIGRWGLLGLLGLAGLAGLRRRDRDSDVRTNDRR